MSSMSFFTALTPRFSSVSTHKFPRCVYFSEPDKRELGGNIIFTDIEVTPVWLD